MNISFMYIFEPTSKFNAYNFIKLKFMYSLNIYDPYIVFAYI